MQRRSRPVEQRLGAVPATHRQVFRNFFSYSCRLPVPAWYLSARNAGFRPTSRVGTGCSSAYVWSHDADNTLRNRDRGVAVRGLLLVATARPGERQRGRGGGNACDLNWSRFRGDFTMLHQRTYLNTRQAAALLGLSPRTLERYRVTGEGPMFAKLGRRVCYARTDLDDWADGRRRRSTSDNSE